MTRSTTFISLVSLVFLLGCDSSTTSSTSSPPQEPATPESSSTPEATPSQQPPKTRGAGGCGPEIKEFCADVEMGGGRIVTCLVNHRDKLSATCKDSLGLNP